MHVLRSGKVLSERNTATMIGVLFLIGTVSGALSAAVTNSILGASDYLAQIATHRSQMAAGALLVLTMGFALAMVPVVFYPVGRRYSEVLAMGYVVFRGAFEGFAYMLGALGWLLLVALSKAPAATSGPIADAVKSGESVLWDQVLAIPFVLGALMFYYLLYTSRLVPRSASS